MIDTILFDFDGTIVDTNELIITTFLHVLEGKTAEPLTREKILPYMGLPLGEQLQLFSGQEDVRDLVLAYREYNLKRHDELVRKFPNVDEVLKKLHENGIRMGIVTNKVRLTTEKGLRLFGYDAYMDEVVTAEDVEVGKPDPAGVLVAVSLLQADPKKTLMVGDSHFDLLAGQRAGVLSAGVAWSLKGEEFLQTYHPDYMLHDMWDLLEIVGIKRDEPCRER
ncbi:pyrophosphatase PpaX [Gorillibacterium timonense]|uniref:pyrophosphatase PpaX n=1 Tax=Gorillibacterium timonense TaxID=1689269 RepID=UPI00071E4952|nr:pyrophosphatase PpaX [Gorillibacterium timonense]